MLALTDHFGNSIFEIVEHLAHGACEHLLVHFHEGLDGILTLQVFA